MGQSFSRAHGQNPLRPSGLSCHLSDRYVCERGEESTACSDQVQAIPEIDQVRSVRPQPESRASSASYSPISLAPSYDHIQSPSLRKRRRLSGDDDLDTREQIAARLHRSPPRSYHSPNAAPSPQDASRRASVLSMAESWASSTRTSPHTTARGPPAISPLFDSSSITRSDWRPQLPSLTALTFDRAAVPAPRAPGSWSEYGVDATSRASTQPSLQSISPTEPAPSYQPAPTYAYAQPRGLSYSGPSTGHSATHNQAPFSTIHPSGFVGYPYPIDPGDMGSDSKQRKRRGNLPKETTDTLRAWFREHLVHPYPSEEEKQRMMKATGLQMSEWFFFTVILWFCLLTTVPRPNLQLVHQRPSAAPPEYDEHCEGRSGCC